MKLNKEKEANGFNLILLESKDCGLPYWKITAELARKSIHIEITNFQNKNLDHTFLDVVMTYSSSESSKVKENFVSITTEDKSKIDEYKSLLISELKSVIRTNMLRQKSIVLKETIDLNRLDKALKSDVFKPIDRDNKFSKI